MSGSIRPTITWTNASQPIYQPYGTIASNVTVQSLTAQTISTTNLAVTSGIINLKPGRFISTIGNELYYWDGTELEQLTSVSSISSLGEWSLEPAISDVNMDGNSLLNANYVECAYLSSFVVDAVSSVAVLLDAQKANISSLHVYDLVAENVTVLSTINTVNYISSSSILANTANINTISSGNAYIANLSANTIKVNTISSGTANFSALNVSSINGSEFTSNTVFVSSINTSQIIAQNVSSATATLAQAFLSTMSFNPSFSGNLGPNISVDMGMGDFVGSVLGGLIGVGVTVPAGIFAIIGGLVSLIAPRPVNNINNNVYEQINMTTQLQVSTLGQQFSTIFRGLSSTVSTIAGNPETVNFEVFTSTISSPPPVVAMRSVGDPLQLVSTPWTEYQAFSQWVEIPSGTGGSNLNLSTLTLLQSTILKSDPFAGATLQVLEAQAPNNYGQVEAQVYRMAGSIGSSNGTLYYRDVDDRPGFIDNTATTHTLAYLTDIPPIAGINSVVAGSNIAVDTSIPTDPVVNLAFPLTSRVFAHEVSVDGLSTDGTQAVTWENRCDPSAGSGIDAYERTTYSNATTTVSSRAELRSIPTFSALNTAYDDITLGFSTVGTLKSQQNQTNMSMETTDITIGAKATLDEICIGGAVVNNYIASNATSINSISEQVNSANALQAIRWANGAPGTTFADTTFANTSIQARTLQQYQFVTGPDTQTYSIEQLCDANRSRVRTGYTSVGGTVTIGNTQTMNTGGLIVSLTQVANSSLSGTATTTLQTDPTNGASLDSTKGVAISSGGGSNITLTPSSNAVITMTNGGLSVTNSTATGTAPPILSLRNNNDTGGTTNPVKIDFYKNDTTTTASDVIMEMSSRANATAFATGVDYTRVRSVVRGVGTNNVDGSLVFQCAVNSSVGSPDPVPFMDLNGGSTAYTTTGAIEVFKPIALSPNATGVTANLTIDASTANGTGALDLKTKNGTAGSGAGLLLTGNTLLNASAGGASGQHLCLTINGTVYKIALLNA